MGAPNLLQNLPAPAAEEVFETLAAGPHARVERIVSHGHASPPGFWYEQPQAEFVLVVAGAARLELTGPDETVELRPGDHLMIAPHRRHRVAWTTPDEPTIWLAVHFDAANT